MNELFRNDSIRVEAQAGPSDENFGLFWMDMPAKSANVLTSKMFEDIDNAWDFVESQDFDGVVILSAKEKIFVAGADLVAISETLNWSDDRIHQFCEDGRKIFGRFRSNPFPVVAAVHGACVGGGFELALWCDERVASNERRSIFGLPEVKLGLVPGWAGTVILPRLIGAEQAAEKTALAVNMSAEEAKELGAVADVVSKDELLESGIQKLVELRSSQSFIESREAMQGPCKDAALSDGFREKLLELVARTADVDNQAAEIVLDQILDTRNESFSIGSEGESRAMAKVYGSDPCAGLLNSFFLNERARKSGSEYLKSGSPVSVERIGIVGCGQMGAGIAKLFSKAGKSISLFDQEIAAAQSAKTAIGDNENVEVIESLEQLSDCDLVIECISEFLIAKRDLLVKINSVVSPGTLIATNTSVIELSLLHESLDHPQRFFGFHFCSPVEQSRIVEIARSEHTSNDTIATATELTRLIRKTPLAVRDGPGLIINRVLGSLFDEANRILLEGPSFEQIDRTMREFGFPLGPFQMMDLIGNDVVYQAGKHTFTFHPERVYVSPIQPKMVKKKWLGIKGGIGFYKYENFDFQTLPFSIPPVNVEAEETVQQYRSSAAEFSDDEIRDRIYLMMLKEACELLADGIAVDPRDVDLAIIFGLAYPADKGGLCFWADWKNPSEWLERYRDFESKFGERFSPPKELSDAASRSAKIYSMELDPTKAATPATK